MKLCAGLIFFILVSSESGTGDQELKINLTVFVPEKFKGGKITLEYEFGACHSGDIAGHPATDCKGDFQSNIICPVGTKLEPSPTDENVSSPVKYRDCSEVPYSEGNGVYRISFDNFEMDAYCEIDKRTGKYLVIQRRLSGEVDFYRGWADYEDGFGNLTGEFWIGNRALNLITSSASYKLRIVMEAFDTTRVFAEYESFYVGPPGSKYNLSVSGYSGNAGDSFLHHNGQKFSTKDQDNDVSSDNCAQLYKGGWWYADCHMSNLNGIYYNGSHQSYADGVNWHAFRGYHESMKVAVMKLLKNLPS